MRYGSVCSGIEAATVAWHPIGFEPAFFSEIDPHPKAVLQHHYPNVPLHGDFLTIGAEEYGTIDILVGGTPCQSFSVAGLRGGISDARGNLSLEFLRLASRKKPSWILWENVPGVLSVDAGRAFGAILGGLAECGYGFAYRILDAQYFGVPQRRRRVFVVGYLGDWRPAAAVLFESESLRGDNTPRREKREIVAALTAAGVGTCGADDNQGQAGHLVPTLSRCDTAREGLRQNLDETLIVHTLRGEGFDASEDGTGRGTPIIAIPILEANGRAESPIPINTQLGLRGPDTSNFTRGGLGIGKEGDPMFTLQAAHQHAVGVAATANQGMKVRRLTPKECERLQGFPDNYTLVPYNKKPMLDGPRYKMIGNSMHTGTIRWLGQRIKLIAGML